MAAPSGESAAKIVLLFVAVAAFNALRRGELTEWGKAKFLNFGDDTPNNARSLASMVLGATPATVGSVGGLVGGTATGATGAPGELVTVGSMKMSPGFAAKMRPLLAAAAADGIIITGTAWRSNARQIQLRIEHGCGGSRIYDRSCKGSPVTAVPGRSRHETGDAIDVKLTGPGGRRSPEYLWLSKNAWRWKVINLPGEPWHWSTDGG